MYQNIPYIARLRHLENHTEAVDPYLINRYFNNLNVEQAYISVASLSEITWMIELSGESSHVMKNCSITAALTPRNSATVAVICQGHLKKMVRPQINVVCLVEF